MRIEMRESFSINKTTIADLERFIALAKQEGATSDTPVQFSDHYSLHIASNIRSLYMFAVRDNIKIEPPPPGSCVMIEIYLVFCAILNFCWLFFAGEMQVEGDFADNAADGFFYWLLGAVAIFMWPLMIAGVILIGPFFLWTQTSWHQDKIRRKEAQNKINVIKSAEVSYPQDKV